jgi:hypothetical protein
MVSSPPRSMVSQFLFACQPSVCPIANASRCMTASFTTGSPPGHFVMTPAEIQRFVRLVVHSCSTGIFYSLFQDPKSKLAESSVLNGLCWYCNHGVIVFVATKVCALCHRRGCVRRSFGNAGIRLDHLFAEQQNLVEPNDGTTTTPNNYTVQCFEFCGTQVAPPDPRCIIYYRNLCHFM